MNITTARKLARSARAHGHFDTGRTLYLRCPQCHRKVEEVRESTYRMSITRQLDRMMISHLLDYCESEQEPAPFLVLGEWRP